MKTRDKVPNKTPSSYRITARCTRTAARSIRGGHSHSLSLHRDRLAALICARPGLKNAIKTNPNAGAKTGRVSPANAERLKQAFQPMPRYGRHVERNSSRLCSAGREFFPAYARRSTAGRAGSVKTAAAKMRRGRRRRCALPVAGRRRPARQHPLH